MISRIMIDGEEAEAIVYDKEVKYVGGQITRMEFTLDLTNIHFLLYGLPVSGFEDDELQFLIMNYATVLDSGGQHVRFLFKPKKQKPKRNKKEATNDN